MPCHKQNKAYSSVSGHPLTEPTDIAQTAVSECRSNKPTSSTIPGSGTTSPNIETTGVMVLDTQIAATPATAREIQQTHQLSAAASSSSIAPTDPTPSAAVADTAKTTSGNSVTTMSDG